MEAVADGTGEVAGTSTAISSRYGAEVGLHNTPSPCSPPALTRPPLRDPATIDEMAGGAIVEDSLMVLCLCYGV